MPTTPQACRIRVRGIVQGVGFRPFAFALARRHGLAGHVMNTADGVEIVLEGPGLAIEAFIEHLRVTPPPAARIAELNVDSIEPRHSSEFCILASERQGQPSAVMSPDLPACDDCVRELFDPTSRRYWYPYITCANCGPRFSLTTALPYDRASTTMAPWPMCGECRREFHDPSDRRFHAQPIACPRCGPSYRLVGNRASLEDVEPFAEAARLLREGKVVGVKGLGGYHLACDARNAVTLHALRERKYRNAQAFALMARDLTIARELVELSSEAETLLTSRGRPIVLGRARQELPGVAPAHPRLGVMLPYAPVHHLLFAAGAPEVLVMTSGNRSSEPIAFEDEDAERRLRGIADALLIGDRPIARRVDDSVVEATVFGASYVRRSRGFAPAAVARLPAGEPILAVGGDLKNSVALVIDGDVLVSQHLGDLTHHSTRIAFEQTIDDFLRLYDIDASQLVVAHDAHPQYVSTAHALEIPARRYQPVQHHRAHVASVLAERGASSARVLGIAFDGTGFGDDGSIWGGEFLVGSVIEGFERVAHLRSTAMPGGDAAATFPVQSAAGFLVELDDPPDFTSPPFHFPARYLQARQLLSARIRTFTTTSAGRLFDTVAALLGFTGAVTFEAQAAVWLEHCASTATVSAAVPFDFIEGQLDWRTALRAVIDLRLGGEETSAIARGFHQGLALGLANTAMQLCGEHRLETVVLTGGVFHNQMLLEMLQESLRDCGVAVWTNQLVPPGDGGLCLGQAALASLRR